MGIFNFIIECKHGEIMTVKNSSVLWSVQQDLSNAQKSQGRSNIDAVTAKKTTTSLPPTDTKIDTLQVFTDGRVRGDSTDLGCLTPTVSQVDAGKVLTANWVGSPGRGFATWEDAPQSTAWGVNTDTTVQFNNLPEDDYDDPNPAINVVGIQNFKNNIVDIAVPSNSQYVFCDNGRLRINPPIITNPQDAYGYNFWVRLAVHRALDSGISRTEFTVEIPNVGWEIDQYWLEETENIYTFSTKRLKIVENTENPTAAPYILTDQQVGPGRYPEKSTLDTYSAPHQVAINYREEWTANTAHAYYDESMSTFRYELNNNYNSNTNYITVTCPSYGYTNYYMIKVSGDMAKLSKFQPPTV